MGIFGLLFIILPLIIFFVVLGIGVTLVRSLLRLFGFGGNSFTRGYGRQSADSNTRQRQEHSQSSFDTSAKPKKVIAEDEGEYVDFEEVK